MDPSLISLGSFTAPMVWTESSSWPQTAAVTQVIINFQLVDSFSKHINTLCIRLCYSVFNLCTMAASTIFIVLGRKQALDYLRKNGGSADAIRRMESGCKVVWDDQDLTLPPGNKPGNFDFYLPWMVTAGAWGSKIYILLIKLRENNKRVGKKVRPTYLHITYIQACLE